MSALQDEAGEMRDDGVSFSANYASLQRPEISRSKTSSFVVPDSSYTNDSRLTSQISTCEDRKTLSWVNITATITIREIKCQLLPTCDVNRDEFTKHVLRKVSGIAKPQSCMAILGSSGSGKTTLLNCLTQRNLGSLKVEGHIEVNGENIGENICGISGYVQQDDIFFGGLTVKEHLWFNAALRLKEVLSESGRQERIDQIIKEMGLKECQNTTIGSPGAQNGISGGEKKRLAFAAELLTKPSIIFCDEPTSRLDSFSARSTVQALKDLARKGHTILATIHQPSSEIYTMFDEFMIMAEGRVAFLGSKKDAKEFFSGMGYPCPQNYNAAEFFMNELAIIPGQEKESEEKITDICNSFEESSYFDAMKSQIQESEAVSGNRQISERENINEEIQTKHKYTASWSVQLKMCYWRSQLEFMREKDQLPAKFVQLLLTAIATGAIYWQQPYTAIGLANINAVLFMIMVQISYSLSFASTIQASRTFVSLVKEYYDRQYSVSAFFLAGILVEIPFVVLVTFTYITCAYWMIGLYSDVAAFFTTAAALVMLSFNAVAIGHLCASLFRDPQLALTLQAFVNGLQLLFSGYLIKLGSSPKLFRIIEGTSIFRYTYEILIISQWRNVQYIECESSNEINESYNKLLTASVNLNQDESIIYYDNGMDVILSYGYHIDFIGSCFGIMAIIIIVTEIMSYIALTFKVKREK